MCLWRYIESQKEELRPMQTEWIDKSFSLTEHLKKALHLRKRRPRENLSLSLSLSTNDVPKDQKWFHFFVSASIDLIKQTFEVSMNEKNPQHHPNRWSITNNVTCGNRYESKCRQGHLPDWTNISYHWWFCLFIFYDLFHLFFDFIDRWKLIELRINLTGFMILSYQEDMTIDIS